MNFFGILPIIFLIGLASGVLNHAIWPMECAALALLTVLFMSWCAGFRSCLTQSMLGVWTGSFLVLWLLWSAIGAAWISPVPAVAWWSLAHDALGIGVFISGIYYAQKMGNRRWRDPLRAVAVLVIGIVVASWFSGDLFNRSQNIWGGINSNLLANLFIPLLVFPFAVLGMRKESGSWDRWLLLIGLMAGLIFCWLSGRRLAVAAIVLAIGGALIFRVPRRDLRLMLGFAMLGLMAVVVAMAMGFLPGTESGDALRPLLYRAAWGEFMAHPMLGIGPAGGYAMQEGMCESARVLTASGSFVIHAHSTVLEVLVSGGAIGFGLLAAAAACLLGSVAPSRRVELGCVIGAVLPAILVDASPGSLLGHVWVPFVLGCAWTADEAPLKSPNKAASLIGAVGLLTAITAGISLWTQSLTVARITRNPAIIQYLAAIKNVRNPDFVSQFVSFTQNAPDLNADSESLRIALSAAHHYCGWFVHWPELAWSMRRAEPTIEDMDALAAVLRRTPFQDAPYGDLAAIDLMHLSPTLRVRAQAIARADADSPDLDGAVVVWRQTIATALARPLSDAERERYRLILERYPEIPGIAAAGLWLYARGALNDAAIFSRIRMGLRLARTDTSLFMGMMSNLTPEQLARLADLDRKMQLGLPWPQTPP